MNTWNVKNSVTDTRYTVHKHFQQISYTFLVRFSGQFKKNSQKLLHIPFPLLGDWLKINAKVIKRKTPVVDMVEGEGTELYNIVYVLRWRAKNVWGVLQISVRFKDDQLTLN